jgi:hypothetical protein
MNSALSKTLGQVQVKEPVSHGSLHLFALAGGPSEEEGLALLEDAMEGGSLRVEELGESGSVPELRVTNSGTTPVLILEGDELVGAKQNRVANSSVLIGADSKLVLPVSCVERGRWSYRSGVIAPGSGSPHVSLRHLKSRSVHASLRSGRGHRSDQSAVWNEVDRKAYLHNASSPTDALQDTRASMSGRLAPFRNLIARLPESARGVAVAFGSDLVLAEVLAGPHSFGKVFGKLLLGYAFEALEREDNGVPQVATVEEFILTVAETRLEEHPAVGLGRDVRFEAEGLSGYALVGDRGVLHAAAFAA